VALTQYLPPPLPLVVLALSVMAAPFLPRRHPAAWLGVLMVLATPTLRVYGLLFLLPGMLVIRMELALLAALAISTYTYGGTWIAIALVVLPLAFSPWGSETQIRARSPRYDRPADACHRLERRDPDGQLLSGLQIGDARVDLRCHRLGGSTRVEVSSVTGDLRVAVLA